MGPTILILLVVILAGFFAICVMCCVKPSDRANAVKALKDVKSKVGKLKALYEEKTENSHFSRDGSVSFFHDSSTNIPRESLFENKVQTFQALYVETISTTITEEHKIITNKKTTIQVSSSLLALLGKLKKAQVKIKSLVSFGQISVSVYV